MTHLGELGGGLRAGHAAADHDDGVAALGVAHRVGRGVGEGDRRIDDAPRLVGDGGDVVPVHPAAALADVGDLELQAARHELLEAARGEVGGAAGEDERAPVTGLHQLEELSLADAAAPVVAAHDVGAETDVLLEPVEVEVLEGAGALAEQHERVAGAGPVRRGHARTSSEDGESAWSGSAEPVGAASAFGGRASMASAGQPRAQVPQPRHFSSS